MRANERELFFFAGIFHGFAKRAMQIFQIGKRFFGESCFRNPRRMFKDRADDADKFRLAEPVEL